MSCKGGVNMKRKPEGVVRVGLDVVLLCVAYSRFDTTLLKRALAAADLMNCTVS